MVSGLGGGGNGEMLVKGYKLQLEGGEFQGPTHSTGPTVDHTAWYTQKRLREWILNVPTTGRKCEVRKCQLTLLWWSLHTHMHEIPTLYTWRSHNVTRLSSVQSQKACNRRTHWWRHQHRSTEGGSKHALYSPPTFYKPKTSQNK